MCLRGLLIRVCSVSESLTLNSVLRFSNLLFRSFCSLFSVSSRESLVEPVPVLLVFEVLFESVSALTSGATPTASKGVAKIVLKIILILVFIYYRCLLHNILSRLVAIISRHLLLIFHVEIYSGRNQRKRHGYDC